LEDNKRICSNLGL